MRNVIYIFVVFLISGCAAKMPPKADLIDSIPVVKIGDSSNTEADHIVYIPKNTEFPVVFSLKGTLLNSEVNSTAMTSFSKDLYLYKYWSSLDGKKWEHSHKLLKVQPSGGFDKSGGTVEVKLDFAN